ncbi:MAG TPA: O-antigen ligase family protein [Solirubrobacteraceae bacterium]|nr:O-antigen ligase family protein [Solirubrobacteraceae bacterium]
MSAGVIERPISAPPLGRLLLPGVTAVLFGVGLASGRLWLIALALIPLVVAIIARPEGATAAFAFVFYLNIPVLVAQATGANVVGQLAVALLLIPLVAHVLVRREAIVLTPALGLMIVYLAVLVISSLHGGSHPASAEAVTVFLTEGLVLYLLVTNSVRTPGVLRIVVWALLLAGATMGAISIWQELTGTTGSALGGLAQRTNAETSSRLAGPIGETNRFAQIMLVLVPLAVWAARVERRAELRVAAVGSALLILSGIILTLSRGAGVALGLLALAMLASGFVRVRHILVVGVVLAGFVVTFAPRYVDRLQSLEGVAAATSEDRNAADNAIRGRATENLAALNVFADHPILGVGPGQFFTEYSQRYANDLDLRFLDTRRRAHNLYLELAADVGLLGLFAFLAIVITTIVQLWRLARFWTAAWRPELADLARAFALSLVAYLATGIFLQLTFQRYFWFLLALANAAIWVLTREAARTAR